MHAAGSEKEIVEDGRAPLRAVEVSTRITDDEVPLNLCARLLSERGTVDIVIYLIYNNIKKYGVFVFLV